MMHCTINCVIALSVIFIPLFGCGTSARGETICYFQKADGQVVDLSNLCGISTKADKAVRDYRFTQLVSALTNDSFLTAIKPAEKNALPKLGQQICTELDEGNKLAEIKSVGGSLTIHNDLLFAFKIAAIEMYCPQHRNAL